jgi:hypothetical protein
VQTDITRSAVTLVFFSQSTTAGERRMAGTTTTRGAGASATA